MTLSNKKKGERSSRNTCLRVDKKKVVGWKKVGRSKASKDRDVLVWNMIETIGSAQKFIPLVNPLFNQVLDENWKYVFYFYLKPNELLDQPKKMATHPFLPGESHGQRSQVGYSPAESLQSCPTLCDPIASSSPGFPIPGILQARTVEWLAISFSSRELSLALSQTLGLLSWHFHGHASHLSLVGLQ